MGAMILGVMMAAGPYSREVNYYKIGGVKVDYQQYHAGQNTFVISSIESNITFLLSDMFILASMMGFMITKPWKQEFYRYLPFTVPFVVVFVYTCLLYVVPAVRPAFFHIKHLNSGVFNRVLLGLGLAVGVFIILLQKWVLVPGFRWLDEQRERRRREGRADKIVEE